MIAEFNSGDSTMDITFHIGDFSLEITVPGNPFHHKNNSDITFCKGCHAFILNFTLFNKTLPSLLIEGLRFPDWPDFDFDFNLPVCLFGQFFDSGRCTDCDGCMVCQDTPTNCLDFCFDPLCGTCDDANEGSCLDCSFGGVFSILNGVCECADGFFRSDSNSECSIGGVACSALNLIDRCDRCSSDNGLLFGDCLSCKGSFFLQPFSRSCLDYCPSGSIGLLNICGEFPLGPVF